MSAETRVRVFAGPHDRRHVPVSVPVEPHGDRLVSVDAASGGRAIPSQILDDRVWWIVRKLRAGTIAEYCIRYAERQRRPRPRLHGQFLSGDRIRIVADRDELAVFHFGRRWTRPFWNPVRAPGGAAITRSIVPEPAGPDAEEPSHRGLWIGHESVNGIDNWCDSENHGWTRVAQPPVVSHGPVLAQVRTRSRWQHLDDDSCILAENASVTFFAPTPEWRLIDCDIVLQATHGPVSFGPILRGAVLTIRLAPPLEPRAGSRLTSSLGGLGADECTAFAGAWCDASAVVGNRWVGVALFEHPRSYGAASRWTVSRDGVFGVNPFAEPVGGQPSLRLPIGGELRLRYRLCLHVGNSIRARVADRFVDYAFPPTVVVAT